MKSLTLLVLLGSISVYANKTLVITNDSDLGAIIGFSDSSFNYDLNDTKKERSFCFVGNVNEVCAQIKQAAFDMNARYYQGSHDRIEIQSCEVRSLGDYEYGSDFVDTAYELSDDYGSEFSVSRRIEKCPTI